MKAPYKFVYLANYAISLAAIVGAIICHAMDAGSTVVAHWFTGALFFFPTFTVLSLWATPFIVNSAYKGVRCLDRRTTMSLTGLLAIAAALTIAVELGRTGFFKASIAFTAIFAVALVASLFNGKLIKTTTNATNL